MDDLNPFQYFDMLPHPWNYILAAFVWPAVTGIINAFLWKKTPEEWLAIIESDPKRAAATRIMRALGWEPAKLINAMRVLLSPLPPKAAPSLDEPSTPTDALVVTPPDSSRGMAAPVGTVAHPFPSRLAVTAPPDAENLTPVEPFLLKRK